VIENLLSKVDTLIIAGGMAYTFLKAKGLNIGKSICEEDKIELAAKIIKEAEKRGVKLLLPSDNIVAYEFENDTEYKVVASDSIPEAAMGMDIGPDSIKSFSEEIKNAKTIVWNGPIGVFEFENFANGTREIARTVGNSGAYSIVGGGDSAAAVEQLGFSSKITHVSTGGGASLEFLAGKDLPGLSALMDKERRIKLIAGNWKMNKIPNETEKFIEALKLLVEKSDSEILVCVPFINLPVAIKAATASNIKIGAQNMHWEEKGAYTGEVSAEMLSDLGVEYVIIGHSERRQYFAETDETVNKKVHAALNFNLKPIICVGETLKQREQGLTSDFVRYQVKAALYKVTTKQLRQIVIAYEPIWAIGTGQTATSQQADEVCSDIRKTLTEMYGEKVSQPVRILYGGSVNTSNARELFSMQNIDGGLIGGASLKIDEFGEIANWSKQ
jgi:triosephosphate isomerase